MSDSFIDYDAKVQDALRHVVRSVLQLTENEGLLGEHHFYVAFKTQAEGVKIPDHLVNRFPDEMTIVIQNKFWGLKVHPEYFEIGLSFNQQPEHLVVPFDAIVGFVDPSVQFALQFHDENDVAEVEAENISNAAGQDTNANISQLDNPADPSAPADTGSTDQAEETDNIVTLDAFRRK